MLPNREPMAPVFLEKLSCTGTPPHFYVIFKKGNNFHDFLISSLDEVALLKGSTLKEKNLLQEEQILSFKS